MLTGLIVGNLRLFEGDGWMFPFAPLTVICGTNSSGKSTLVKVPLLLKQSQSYSQIGKATHGQLRFAGEEVDLGGFRTLISHEDVQRELVLGVAIDDRIPAELLEVSGKKRPRSSTRSGRSASFPYTLSAIFTFRGVRPDGSRVAAVDGPSDSAARLNARLKTGSFTLESEGLRVSWDVRESSDDNGGYLIEFPEVLLTALGLGRYFETEPAGKGRVAFRVRLSGNLPTQLHGAIKASEARHFGGPEAGRFLSFPLPPLIEGAVTDLSQALARLHYLGPLRAPGKRYYVASSDTLPSLDAVGEFLPYVLRDRLDTEVTCVLPGLSLTPAQIPLREALNSWVQYLRSGETTKRPHGAEVQVQATRDVLVELQVKGLVGDELHGIADSGFGYSQALPILVRCLLAEPGSTVLIEQPELHLNPALQVRLGEFFVSCVLGGRQIVLETHSEHIINCIRVLTAEGVGENLAAKVRILYLDSAQPPTVHDLAIKSDGMVPEWPRDFFGEALTLSARLFAAQRRFVKS